MKLLITGAENYIAKSFIDKFGKRHKIAAYTSSELDVTNISALIAAVKNKKFDAVLHLAECYAPINTVDKDIEIINTVGFKNIQTIAKGYGIDKIIVFSNIRELNISKGIEGFKEGHGKDFIPQDSYGLSKYNITNMAKLDSSVYVLRVFGLYGIDADNSIITDIISDAAKGRNIILENDYLMSAIYIDDLVKIVNEFLTKKKESGEYNIAGDELISISELARRLRKAAENKIVVEIPKSEPINLTASNDKLSAVLGPFKFTSSRSSVVKMFKFIKDDV